MSIRQLKTFLAIADLGSFAAAAERMGITHSAVSVQVRNLEEEFGAILFDRHRKPPVLNEAGRALVPQIREIVQRFEALSGQLREGAGLSGEFRLGSVGSVLTGLLPPVLAKLRQEFSGLHVSLTSGFTEELVATVRSGRLDAAIVSDFGSSGSDLTCREILKEPLVFVAPTTAPDEPVRALIKQYPFIRYAPDASMGRIIDTAIRAAKLRVNEQMRLDWIEAIEAMVANGLGVSVIPLRTAGRGSSNGLRAMAFGNQVRYRTLFLVELRDHRRGQFCDVLVERLKSASCG